MYVVTGMIGLKDSVLRYLTEYTIAIKNFIHVLGISISRTHPCTASIMLSGGNTGKIYLLLTTYTHLYKDVYRLKYKV